MKENALIRRKHDKCGGVIARVNRTAQDCCD